jgi:hypothetical protein
LDNAIQNYMSANDDRLPDRVVIHKSSGYDAAEQDGFNEVTDRSGVKFRDLLALGRSNIRLFRHWPYPPLRGTHIILEDENSLLYTRRSVPFYRKYPGPYVPRPLHIRYFQTDRSESELGGRYWLSRSSTGTKRSLTRCIQSHSRDRGGSAKFISGARTRRKNR